ncbi:MAG: hypothetical protein D8M59_16650 [Planctomycetes bacterium]|nr:hypothetical protein [Planctomycetota bacterium]NOG53151.1 hypothetical protein [Planctomycetota bacterium]
MGDPDGNLGVGHGANRAAYAMRALITMANDLQMIYDQHLYYEDINQVDYSGTGDKGVLIGLFDSSAPWPQPDSWSMTEVGPIPTSGYMLDPLGPIMAWQYYEAEGGECTVPVDPEELWDESLADWQDAAYEAENHDFYLERVYDDLDGYGAVLALYGTSIQREKGDCSDPNIFDSLALYASRFLEENVNDESPATFWTILDGFYDDAAAAYYNGSFDPHPDESDNCD